MQPHAHKLQAQEPWEGFCSVEHGQLWYRVHPGPANRPPIIVLHGGPGCPSTYLHSLSALADLTTVVFYDQLGCGRSTSDVPVSALTLDSFTMDLQVLLDTLRFESFVLLGHSFGGLLALHHQRCFPHTASALLLASPLVATSDWMADMTVLTHALPEPYADDLNKPPEDPAYVAAEAEFYRTHFCHLQPWPPELQVAVEQLAASPAYHLMWGPTEFTQTGNLKGADCSDVLHTLRCPVLFTCGSADEARPETLRRYADICERGQLKVFEGGTHCVHLEQPDEFLQVIRGFFRHHVLPSS